MTSFLTGNDVKMIAKSILSLHHLTDHGISTAP
jgi:hypothetical protein